MANLLDLALSGAARLRDRIAGSVRVHVEKYRMVGDRSGPGLMLEGVWAENTSGQNQFVSDFEAKLSLPVQARTKATEWRVRNKPVVATKGANLPAHGRTDMEWDIIVWLDTPLPTATGAFEGTLLAVGRQGFRQKRTPLAGTYSIGDTSH